MSYVPSMGAGQQGGGQLRGDLSVPHPAARACPALCAACLPSCHSVLSSALQAWPRQSWGRGSAPLARAGGREAQRQAGEQHQAHSLPQANPWGDLGDASPSPTPAESCPGKGFFNLL